jgi:hypothetical protein
MIGLAACRFTDEDGVGVLVEGDRILQG